MGIVAMTALVVALAQPTSALPPGGVPLFTGDLGAFTVGGGPEERTTRFEGGIRRIDVLKKGPNGWTVQLQSPNFSVPLKRGDVIYLGFEARAIEARQESGEGSFGLFVQRNTPPWDGLLGTSGSVGRAWRTFHFGFQVQDRDWEPGVVAVTLHLSDVVQKLEFRNFIGRNYGTSISLNQLPFTAITYAGSELDAPWRKKAAAQIERYRKSPLTIEVRDARNRPVRDARVRVRQLRHQYPFASFYDGPVDPTNPETARYQATFLRLFNRATVPIYWSDWGWESERELARYREILRWCRANNLRMKAHNVLWPSFAWMPTRMRALQNDKPALERALFEAMDARLAELRSQPFENVDVLNELKSERDVANLLGDLVYRKTFDRAKAAWPKAELVYNDYSVFEGGAENTAAQEEVERQITRLQQMRAPVTMLGWQAHFGESLTPPEMVWRTLDRFGKFGLPFEITEFDVTTRDEIAQADYTRDLMTAWFADPRTRGFTMWGFWEPTHWKPLGAMFRRDWSEKPNLKVWRELTQKTWWTDVRRTTPATGVASVRAFKGDYEVEVVSGKARAMVKLSLGDAAGKVTVRLR